MLAHRTIGKRLAAINLENNETNRRDYRQLLFTTPDGAPRPLRLGAPLCGVRRGGVRRFSALRMRRVGAVHLGRDPL